MLGSRFIIDWQMYLFADVGDKRIYTPSEVYYFAKLYWRLTGDKKLFLIDYKKNYLSEREMKLLDVEVEEQYKKITPMVYIDNFTLRRNWIDRTY